jgi:hypothetical protein
LAWKINSPALSVRGECKGRENIQIRSLGVTSKFAWEKSLDSRFSSSIDKGLLSCEGGRSENRHDGIDPYTHVRDGF